MTTETEISKEPMTKEQKKILTICKKYVEKYEFELNMYFHDRKSVCFDGCIHELINHSGDFGYYCPSVCDEFEKEIYDALAETGMSLENYDGSTFNIYEE